MDFNKLLLSQSNQQNEPPTSTTTVIHGTMERPETPYEL